MKHKQLQKWLMEKSKVCNLKMLSELKQAKFMQWM